MTMSTESLQGLKPVSMDAALTVPGLGGYYDTKADAQAALPLLANGNLVTVFADEDHDGHRTLYQVAGGALVLKVDLTAEILNPGAQVFVSSGVAVTEGADDADRGKEGLLLDYDHAVRGRSRDGTMSLQLMGVRDVPAIDGGIHDFGVLGDSRMIWLSVATDLDLVQNNVIDVSDLGNYYASTCDTRLVQYYDGEGADALTVGVASCDDAGSRCDRLVFNNGAAPADARAWFTNVGAVAVQKGGDAGRGWTRWEQDNIQWQAGFRGEPYAWVLECQTASAQPEHDTGWTRAIRAELDGSVALAGDKVAISALGNVTGPGLGTSISNFNYLTGMQSNGTLHVAGNAALGGDLVLNYAGGGVMMGLGTPVKLNVNNGGMCFTATNLLGLGTSAPGYRLHVNGSIGFSPGSSVTPIAAGHVVFELTSNTTLTVKAKGSDNTVRQATITLA